MATILVVDDRPSNRQFLTTLLGYGGHRMLEAGDGAGALDSMRAERPALVITDILMPNMDGYEFVQRVRSDPELAATPVIFYTATYSTPQAEALARSCGVRKVLHKPSEPQAILTAVNQELGIADQGGAAPTAAAPGPRDDTISLFLEELEHVKQRFEDLDSGSTKLQVRRDAVKELSRKFAENVVSMQRVTTRLSALLEVGMELMGERDPQRLVELFFAATCDLVDAKYAAVGMLDEREQAISIAFAKGFDAAILRGDGGRMGLLGSLLSGQRAMQTRTAAGASGAEGLPAGHPRVRNLLGIPVASADRVYGWMYFADRRGKDGFTEEDTRLVNAMTRKLALLYENAMLYDAIQRHAAQLQIEMSERKRAEAELQRFRLAMDNSADIILIIDRATMRHVDMNLTACKLLGYTREELLRMGPPDILPVSRKELEKTYDELIADPSRASGMRSYYRCKDGSQLPFESTRRVLRSGDTWLIAAISRDIRQRLAAEQALRESEAGLRRAQSMAKLAHVVTGPDGSFESWSETLPQLVGVEPDQLPRSTRAWLDLLDPEDRPVFRDKAIEAGVTRARTKVKYRLRRADGTWIHVRQTMDPLRGEPDAQGRLRWFNSIQDVSEQKQTEERIERLNRVYAVLSGINALIVRVHGCEELFKETCRLAVEAGKFKLAWIGMVDRKEMRLTPVAWHGVGEDYIQLMPLRLGDPPPEGSGLSARAINERKAVVSDDMTQDPRIRLRKEAEERGFHSLAMLPLVVGEEAVGILALYAGEVGFFDEDEMKLLKELAGDIAFALDHIDKASKLDYLAYYDALTGLANRSLFHERLEQAIAAASREKRKLALVIQDIERFKAINDSLGRQVGDTLLKQYAERLSGVARDASWLTRLGADQFAVLVPDVTSEEELARRTEQRVQEMLSRPYRMGEVELTISVRLGIAVYPADGMDADALLRNAEAALKKAKATGERYLFYASEMTERVAEKLLLETKLRQALENDEFVLHYQPKVDLETRKIVGVEALIRWQSAERGLVPPGHFIPLLEETGLILQVGAWALKRAALDHRGWVEQKLKAPRVAVNVSQIQLRQRDFVGVVEQAIIDGVAPTGIDLEITESMVMQDVQANIEKLNAVRALGVRIAIDDFGTGYSSLGYLAKLPVESLKIDRSFIITMHQDPNAMSLVSTIISLAHSLRLKVVAEGVETEDQAKFLRLLRCDEMQGYLFSKPLPEAELVKLLRG